MFVRNTTYDAHAFVHAFLLCVCVTNYCLVCTAYNLSTSFVLSFRLPLLYCFMFSLFIVSCRYSTFFCLHSLHTQHWISFSLQYWLFFLFFCVHNIVDCTKLTLLARLFVWNTAMFHFYVNRNKSIKRTNSMWDLCICDLCVCYFFFSSILFEPYIIVHSCAVSKFLTVLSKNNVSIERFAQS